MSSVYADVIVDITNEKLDRTFQYKVPPELTGEISPGTAVQIPFGNGNRTITGYVLSVGNEPKYPQDRMKAILAVQKDAATVETKLIALAAWMRHTYGSTMIQALKTVLPVKVKARGKETREIALLADPARCEELLENYRKKNYKARIRLLNALLAQPVLPGPVVSKKLKITADTLHVMEEQGVLEIRRTSTWRNPVSDAAGRTTAGKPNEQQQAVVDGIRKEWEGQNRPCLICGVTGSGKTLVYMELMERVLKEGKQVIVLIPEIALTYQNVERFCARFGTRVTVVNSRMTPSERADQMERARRGEVSIMIGPRSALFAPFPDLGLIIIDEEHEGAYKSETAPRYDAREVAKVRADMSRAAVVLGSATPSVESYYLAEQGEYKLLTLTKRAKENSRLAGVHIVDLREELAEGNRSIFSRRLKGLIEDRLANRQQVMLFMNRRGYAGFVSCRSCGKAMKCPHCDVSLTYHKNGRLKCHYCGFERPLPDRCPSCGSPFIAPFGTGTQKLEEFTKREFPKARILRMDADTTAKKGAHEEILATFAEGGADILIGTQMIVKGHDFASVTLVGVMAADLSLYAPDYKSAERTFELLTQASGRAGRGELQGDVVIQTYAPDHYAVSSAAEQDYLQFYRQELLYRKMMGYPPLVRLLTIGLSSKREADVIRASEDMKRVILREYALDGLKVIGPVEDSPYKLNDNYRKILYMKHESYDILLKVRNCARKRENIPDLFRNVFVQYDLT